MKTIEQKKNTVHQPDRIIVETFGLTRPAMFVDGIHKELHMDGFLNPSEISESLSEGTKLLLEMKRAAQSMTPGEVCEQIKNTMPEVYETVNQMPHGEQSFHETAEEYLNALKKIDVQSVTNRIRTKETLKDTLSSLFAPAAVSPEGIKLPIPDKSGAYTKFELKDYVTEEIQSQKIKPLIAALVVFGTSGYFSLKFIAQGTGLPGAEGWLAGVLINAWESFGLDLMLTEPGTTKGGTVMTSETRRKIKVILQKALVYSIPLAYALDAGFTGTGIFQKYPLPTAEAGLPIQALAVVGRLFLAGLVAVAPEVSLNAISKYTKELFGKGRNSAIKTEDKNLIG
jgi:hypothetical protein